MGLASEVLPTLSPSPQLQDSSSAPPSPSMSDVHDEKPANAAAAMPTRKGMFACPRLNRFSLAHEPRRVHAYASPQPTTQPPLRVQPPVAADHPLRPVHAFRSPLLHRSTLTCHIRDGTSIWPSYCPSVNGRSVFFTFSSLNPVIHTFRTSHDPCSTTSIQNSKPLLTSIPPIMHHIHHLSRAESYRVVFSAGYHMRVCGCCLLT